MKKSSSLLLIFVIVIISLISCDKIPASTNVEVCDDTYQRPAKSNNKCSSDSCNFYIEVWKEAFLQTNNMSEDFFNKHVFVYWAQKVSDVYFRVIYDVEINEAYGTASDIFFIKNNTSYYSKSEIKALLLKPGGISKVPNTDEFHFKTFESARQAAEEQLKIKKFCVGGSILNPDGSFTLHLKSKIPDNPNICISARVNFITGTIESSKGNCYPQLL